MLYRFIPRAMRLELARLAGFLGAGRALIGVVAGFREHGGKMGVTGWLVLGVFGAALKIAILFDQFMEDRATKSGGPS